MGQNRLVRMSFGPATRRPERAATAVCLGVGVDGPEQADRRRGGRVEGVEVAGSTGLEPAASGVTGRRSNQLNYDPAEPFGVTPMTPPVQAGGMKQARDSRPLATVTGTRTRAR